MLKINFVKQGERAGGVPGDTLRGGVPGRLQLREVPRSTKDDKTHAQTNSDLQGYPSTREK